MSKPGVCLMAIMCSVGMTSLQLTSGIKDSDRSEPSPSSVLTGLSSVSGLSRW